MATITIFHKPTCSTCRSVVKLAAASDQPYRAVNYYETPFTKTKLKTLLRKGRLSPKDILRTKEEIYKTHKTAIATMSDDDLIALMITHPDLIQRPLVEKGDTVILARPPETVNDLL